MTMYYSAKYHKFQHWSRIFDSGNGALNQNFFICNQLYNNNFDAEIYDGSTRVFQFFTSNPSNMLIKYQ